METPSPNCDNMLNSHMIYLSYHKFGTIYDPYPFSRTYDQFWHDIRKKEFDRIQIDDCHISQIKACEMMAELGIRAQLFCCTGLIGKKGYCSWDQMRELAKHHDIECHSSLHVDHRNGSANWQVDAIKRAIDEITKEIGVLPQYFVPPYNHWNQDTITAAQKLNIVLIKDRITIKNSTK